MTIQPKITSYGISHPNYLTTLFSIFLLFNSVTSYSQDYQDKVLNCFEASDLLAKRAKNEHKGIQFTRCTFNYVPADQNALNVDYGVIDIPASITYVGLLDCKFNRIYLASLGWQTWDIYESKGIEEINLNEGEVHISGNSTINKIHIIDNKGRKVSLFVEESKVGIIELEGANVEAMFLKNTILETVSLKNCTLNHPLIAYSGFFLNGNQTWNMGFKADTIFQKPQKNEAGQIIVNSFDHSLPKVIYDGYWINNLSMDGCIINKLVFENTKFVNDKKSILPIYGCNIETLIAIHSTFGMIDLSESTITKLVEFQESTITGLNLFNADIQTANIPGFNFELLQNHKLFLFDRRNINKYSKQIMAKNNKDSVWVVDQGKGIYFNEPEKSIIDTIKFVSINPYYGLTNEELRETNLFVELTNNYAKLYKIYKEREDIVSSNGCYSEMKDLYTLQTKIIFFDHPSVTNFFRWQLSNVVKLYTNNGTDPAKAITISFWVIICFGIFYFFFPSDWDVISKKRLIQNLKDFRGENEKSYMRLFFTLITGFIISLINAITLSLNSFVTLGFGNIPTHGAARYVTIVEGFIGWFLLSIFTVALINQVLA